MLAFSPLDAAFASSSDPLNALVAERGTIAEPAAPADDAAAARTQRRHGDRGDELHWRALPPRRQQWRRRRLRLQRLHAPRLRTRPGAGTAAQRRRTGHRARAGPRRQGRPEAGRSGVLQHLEAHVLARRHLHRRRPVHPCAPSWQRSAHRRPCATPTGPSASPVHGARPPPTRLLQHRRPCCRPRTEPHGTIAAWAKPRFPPT